MDQDIDRILLSPTEIANRVRELGMEITKAYTERPGPLTLLCLCNGAIVFTADLMRQISLPLQMDTLSVSSYQGTESTGTVTVRGNDDNERQSLQGRHVIIVDDIIDTGCTLGRVKELVLLEKPASISTCVLLKKKTLRRLPNSVAPDFWGFEIDDHFVVGYGLDYNEVYRNLPYIGIVKEEVYKTVSS